MLQTIAETGTMLICRAILTICISNLRNHRDESGEEKKVLLPQLWVSLPNNMDPSKYFICYNLIKACIQDGYKSSGMSKNMLSGWEICSLSPVFYQTVDFKNVVNDLSHVDSTLVENECFKRKMRLSE